MTRSLLALLLIIVLSVPARARTPEEIVSDYVTATKQEGLTGIARFIHPDELARFRAGVEPAIRLALANDRTRAVFLKFADPADVRRLKSFANDGEFLATFMDWVSRERAKAPRLNKNAVVTTLGHVDEGDLCHVVLRIGLAPEKPDTDQITVITTKLHEGEPLLMLPPEVERMMLPFAQHH
jgi:hypothetical protein